MSVKNLARADDYFCFLVEYQVQTDNECEASRIKYQEDEKAWYARSWWDRYFTWELRPHESNYQFYYELHWHDEFEKEIQRAVYYMQTFGNDSQIEIEYPNTFYKWSKNRNGV